MKALWLALALLSAIPASAQPRVTEVVNHTDIRDNDLKGARSNCTTADCDAQMRRLLEVRSSVRGSCSSKSAPLPGLERSSFNSLCKQVMAILDVVADAETDFGAKALPQP